MNKVENKPTKTKLVATVVTLIFLVALVVGLTYALFQYNKLGDTDNQMTTGTLVMEIDDQNATAIQLANAYPVNGKKYAVALEGGKATVNGDRKSVV